MKSIADIQRRLLALGYSVGKSDVDGIMGPSTERALIAFKVKNGLQARPFVGPITLEKLFGHQVAGQKPLGTGEARWLTFARRYSGLREIKGKNHAPEILEMWKTLGLLFKDDETPWCAGFVGFVLESSGIASTRSGMARSYEKWGVNLAKAAVGCVVTFKRTGGGHVGFVVGRDAKGNLMVLGGNQADAVNIKPFAVSRATGYWWPKGEPLPEGAIPTVRSDGKLSTNEA
ncbi:TIGR02594 family protein [Pararhizobium sp. DWP1-1-3]|uniref:NlpC/P60 family protein n=1 Tax=Pararhizobium sp. DWP1-1-3 TaxID=2804652 RepID=UPI003CEDAB3C